MSNSHGDRLTFIWGSIENAINTAEMCRREQHPLLHRELERVDRLWRAWDGLASDDIHDNGAGAKWDNRHTGRVPEPHR